MIILVTYEETLKDTNEKRILISHGYDLETGQNIAMPNVHPSEVGAVFDYEIGEFILV